MKKNTCPLLVKLLSLVGFFLLVGCAKLPLYNSLQETEVNEMLAILESRGVVVEKQAAKEGLWNILVEPGKFAESVDTLNSYGYPKQKYESIGTLFKKSGLVSSPSEERIRFMYGLSQELGATLIQIDGVLDARVHIVLLDNDPLKEIKMPSSASVFIKYRRGSGVESLSSQIKRLVTNSIEGLEYEKVSIVFVPSDLNEFTSLAGAGASIKQESHLGLYLLLGGGVFVILLIIVGAAVYFMTGKKLPLKKSVAGKK